MKGDIEILRWREADTERIRVILGRSQRSLEKLEEDVRTWVHAVRDRGDRGILEYLNRFDTSASGSIGRFRAEDFSAVRFAITAEEREEAFRRISPGLLSRIREQVSISRSFHAAVMESLTKELVVEHFPGVRAGYRRIPVDSAGLYVPAGKAPLPTVAQILTVAAKTAGVPRIVVCFPPTTEEAENAIIVAASEAGATELYRVGGIAAIAALAYGTETIRSVQKIAGPGNPWVQAAKIQVSDRVGIDMFSGPSEAIILADETSNPVFLAADILARCEHGPDSAGVLVTNSERIARETKAEIEKQRESLSRRAYIDEALSRFSAIVLVDSLDEMIEFTNAYMPEHLEIQTSDPAKLFRSIRHAGSTFLGAFAPVAAGDYASGTNHCLPTGIATGYSSAVSPETFLKVLQFQEITPDGLSTLLPIIEAVSDAEGLDAHKRSVQVRFESRDI